MDLGLDLTPRTRGRAAKDILLEVERELTTADLALLSVERGIEPRPIQRLRDRHHSLARCLASGMSEAEASVVTSYSLSRISILKSDPAFKDLVDFYRANVDAAFADTQARMATLTNEAIAELSDRLEEKPDEFSIKDLVEVTKVMADRSGNGPQTKTTQVNVNIDLAARMEAGRRRAEQARIVDASFVEVEPK